MWCVWSWDGLLYLAHVFDHFPITGSPQEWSVLACSNRGMVWNDRFGLSNKYCPEYQSCSTKWLTLTTFVITVLVVSVSYELLEVSLEAKTDSRFKLSLILRAVSDLHVLHWSQSRLLKVLVLSIIQPFHQTPELCTFNSCHPRPLWQSSTRALEFALSTR